MNIKLKALLYTLTSCPILFGLYWAIIYHSRMFVNVLLVATVVTFVLCLYGLLHHLFEELEAMK